MSAAEFCRWQGYLRRNPAGGKWLAREFAELKRETAKGRLGPLKKVPDIRHFEWTPPQPLFYLRKKQEAKAKK